MTKKEIDHLLRSDQGFWNSVKVVNGVRVARVCWHNNQYKVIHDNIEFKDITKTVESEPDKFGFRKSIRVYEPIKEFYYKKELVDYIASFQG